MNSTWPICSAKAIFPLIANSAGQLTELLNLATHRYFLHAPLIAIVNFHFVRHVRFPAEARPGLLMRWPSYAGILFLTGFGCYYPWLIMLRRIAKDYFCVFWRALHASRGD